MENTVTLSLKRYHELLKFELKMSKKESDVPKHKHTYYFKNNLWNTEVIITDDEATKEIAEDLKKTIALLNEANERIQKLESQTKERNFFKYILLYFKPYKNAL